MKSDTQGTNRAAEVTAALERILSQPDFLASPRLCSFLQFVVTETLEGRSDRLKAFTVASMALGHDEKFNPKTNSIVRVQAGRLRRLLDYYYRGPGRLDRCEIRLPRGSYVPEFVFRSENEGGAPPSSAPDTLGRSSEGNGEPVGSKSLRRFARESRGLVVAASLLVMVGAVGLGAAFWSRGAPVAFPSARHPAPAIARRWAGAGATLTVDPIQGVGNDPTRRRFAGLLENGLEDALSRFDNPIVLHSGSAAPPSSVADYHLSGRVTEAAAGKISLAFRIWRPASGEIIWSRTFDDLRLQNTEAALEPTVDALTAAVAQTYGVVFTDMRKRLRGKSEGFGCVILASDYFRRPSVAAHRQARDCLERTLARHPDFAPGFAALSYLLIDTYLTGVDARPGEKPLERASEMANRAVDLAPRKARAHTAVFQARFFDKRFRDAFAAAKQALELNPYATDNAARIGFAHVLRGDFDAGIPLLQRALRFSPSTPGWYQFPFFLDAYMRGDQAAAFRHARRYSATQFPLGMVARIVVAHERGDSAGGRRWTRRLFAEYPMFAGDLSAAFDRYAMAPEIKKRLLTDLAEAGYPLHGR